MIKAHTLNTHTHACTIIAHKNHAPPSGTFVIGIDEVGRGSLFGQMTVGAVILDKLIWQARPYLLLMTVKNCLKKSGICSLNPSNRPAKVML